MLPWGSGSSSMCAVHPGPTYRNQCFQPTMTQVGISQFVVRRRLCPLHSTEAFGPATTPAAALCLRLAATGAAQPAMLPSPDSSRSAPTPLISLIGSTKKKHKSLLLIRTPTFQIDPKQPQPPRPCTPGCLLQNAPGSRSRPHSHFYRQVQTAAAPPAFLCTPLRLLTAGTHQWARGQSVNSSVHRMPSQCAKTKPSFAYFHSKQAGRYWQAGLLGDR
jgi:hypothetical protein